MLGCMFRVLSPGNLKSDTQNTLNELDSLYLELSKLYQRQGKVGVKRVDGLTLEMVQD